MYMRKLILALILGIATANSATAQTRSDLCDSLSAAVQVLAFHPDSLELRMKKAAWNIELEQWRYAQEEYDFVLRCDEKNIAALFYRAYVNERQGRYKFARLDYENLLRIVPGHFEATLGLALLNQKDNRPTEAFNQINTLVAQHPNNAVAYAARGGIEVERKMYTPAEYDFTRAIELDPKNTDYRLNRANVRLLTGRKNEAREDLDAMVGQGVPRANLVEWYKKCR